MHIELIRVSYWHDRWGGFCPIVLDPIETIYSLNTAIDLGALACLDELP